MGYKMCYLRSSFWNVIKLMNILVNVPLSHRYTQEWSVLVDAMAFQTGTFHTSMVFLLRKALPNQFYRKAWLQEVLRDSEECIWMPWERRLWTPVPVFGVGVEGEKKDASFVYLKGQDCAKASDKHWHEFSWSGLAAAESSKHVAETLGLQAWSLWALMEVGGFLGAETRGFSTSMM